MTWQRSCGNGRRKSLRRERVVLVFISVYAVLLNQVKSIYNNGESILGSPQPTPFLVHSYVLGLLCVDTHDCTSNSVREKGPHPKVQSPIGNVEPIRNQRHAGKSSKGAVS